MPCYPFDVWVKQLPIDGFWDATLVPTFNSYCGDDVLHGFLDFHIQQCIDKQGGEPQEGFFALLVLRPCADIGWQQGGGGNIEVYRLR